MMGFWSSKSGINSKYSFSSSPTFVTEPWSVYSGRPKSSSSNSNPGKVSVFIFDKKQFENYLMRYNIIKSKSSSHDKKLIQEGYDVLRNQVNNLAKLKHPNVLTLVEPLEEHSKNFMFVTEFVTGSLGSIFSSEDNDEQDFLKGYIKDDIVIQRGILQVVNALDFIHNRASSVHLNIEPNSVLINENSDWKVSGLGHLFKLPEGTSTADYYFPQYDPRTPKFMSLNLDYTAPELVFENTISCKNDYFSLGLLISFLYNGKNVILKTENSASQYKDEYKKLERKISSMSWENVFSKLPQKLKPCMVSLMNRDIYSRYDNITEFADSEFFHDPLIKVLNYLDGLPTKSNEEKIVYLNGLVELLPQFPNTILQKKFLPVLLELMNLLCSEKPVDSQCVDKNLEIILKIGGTLSQLSFSEKIVPILSDKINFKILLENATKCLVANLSILQEKVKTSEFLELIMNPLLTYTLEDNTRENAISIQESVLEQIGLLLESYDFSSTKNFLLPLLGKLFVKTTSLTIKVACVDCFRVMVTKKAIDKFICKDDVLPLFKTMKTRDARILMKSLSLFEVVPEIVTDEDTLVEQLLPLLWSFSMASTLGKSDYRRFVNVINKLSSDLQTKHIGKLTDAPPIGSMETSKGFSKIIQENEVKKPEDPDIQASKSVSAPVMNPTRKPSATRNPSQTVDNYALPMRRRTVPQKVQSNTGHATNSMGISKPPGTERPKAPYKDNNHNSDDDDDDWDSFVSSSPSVAASKPPVMNSSRNMATPSTPSDNNRSLPPGFSVSMLTPNKKNSPAMNNANNSESGSLI